MNLILNEKEQRLRAGWRLLLQFVLMFFMVGILSMGFNALWQSNLRIVSTAAQCIGVLASIWVAARLLDKRSLAEYGMTLNMLWWKDFFAGFIIAAAAIIIIFTIEWLFDWISIIGFGWQNTASFPFLPAISSSFFSMLLVGFYEEWFSRGYQLFNLAEGFQYQQLGAGGAVVVATLISSALFGILHY